MHETTQFWLNNTKLRHIYPIRAGISDREIDGPEYYATIKKMVRQKPLIDLGCGPGRLSHLFDPKKYFGIDINPTAIAVAQRRNPGYVFEVINPEQSYPLEHTYFINAVLHHVHETDLDDMIQRIMQAAQQRIVLVEIMDRRFQTRNCWCRPPKFYRNKFTEFELVQQKSIVHPAYANHPDLKTRSSVFQEYKRI